VVVVAAGVAVAEVVTVVVTMKKVVPKVLAVLKVKVVADAAANQLH
jgi:hypothetical protein